MADLILDSLEIQNFRAFRHLKIERLGRVNLITGKNNVGKTCLLEAVALYARCGDPTAMTYFLIQRGDLPPLVNARLPVSDIQSRYSAVCTLFYEGRDNQHEPSFISIGPISSPDDILTITVNPYVWSREPGTIQLEPVGQQITNVNNIIPTIELLMDGNKLLFPLDHDYTEQNAVQPFLLKQNLAVFVPAIGVERSEGGLFWDRISLTDAEKDVLNALKILVPSIIGFNYIISRQNQRERVPTVRVENSGIPIPLHSMGEGMNRILGIVLALVNAKDGILLIDEVETGLHYSVLPDVWKLVFEVAHRLNVQVFATTHSWDCIAAFQEAANNNTDEEGLLIRLENKDGEVTTSGTVSTTVFDERKLAIAAREHIEVR